MLTGKSVMTLKEDIRSVSVSMETPDLLRYLIKEKFPGQSVVTASLKAPSIVVLKMVADIDPSTPVIFCHRPPVFEESTEYRARIVSLLRLSRISLNEGHETAVVPGDMDHKERMWVEHANCSGRSMELLHLNQALSPYSCWISAVYHVARSHDIRNRVDVEGRLIRVDPLIRWPIEDVRKFMRSHDLPYHKRATRTYATEDPNQVRTHDFYDY